MEHYFLHGLAESTRKTYNSLTFRDVTADSVEHPQVLRVRLKASKTDPFRVGIQFQDGRFLTRARPLVMEVKEAISAAGVDSSPYSGYSFRSGAATTAARQGIAEATIQKLGRWKSSAYNTKDAKTRAGGSVTAPGRQPMRLRRTKLWDGVQASKRS